MPVESSLSYFLNAFPAYWLVFISGLLVWKILWRASWHESPPGLLEPNQSKGPFPWQTEQKGLQDIEWYGLFFQALVHLLWSQWPGYFLKLAPAETIRGWHTADLKPSLVPEHSWPSCKAAFERLGLVCAATSVPLASALLENGGTFHTYITLLRLSTAELMLLNCGAGEYPCESFEQQGDQTGQF